MKKSTRILAVLMAFAMLIGSFSVVGSAYQAYKGEAIKDSYNDIDTPTFTTEQYASMGLDELDRMLAEENLFLNVYVGSLDLRSVDSTLTSAVSLVESLPSTLLSLLKDAKELQPPILKLKGYTRGTKTDLEIVYALLNLLGDLSPIVQKYAAQTLDLGIANGFVKDYMFNVRELLIGLLYGLTPEGKTAKFNALKDELPAKYKTDNATLTLLQDLLNYYVLGTWEKLDDKFGDIANSKDKYSYVLYKEYAFSEKYGETAPDTTKYDYYGWVHPNQWVTFGLGGCVRVNEGATTGHDPDYSLVDITGNVKAYDFIEAIMRQAYNYVAVPVLNRLTRPWLRQLCGVEYLAEKKNKTVYNQNTQLWENNPTYDPNYDGEAFDEAELMKTNTLAKLFNLNAVVPKVDFSTFGANDTFVDKLNDIAGEFANAILKNNVQIGDQNYSWTWIQGGNQYLFQNVCSVAKFVLQISGDLFFPSYFKTVPASEIATMNDQQVVSYVLRAIFNGSVKWIYIDESCQTIADVCYSAVEQLAWQDIPEITYTKPNRSAYGTDGEYNTAIVNKCLDILFDVAVYNLNQGLDMVPGKTSSNPITANGLLKYQGDTGSYENNFVQIAAWAVSTYGSILALDFKSDDYNGSVGRLTANDVWSDFDTIIDAIIPIKSGNNPWISEEIAGNEYVAKSFIFDNIVYPLINLDASGFAEIFKRNPNGAFATMTGIPVIINIINNVFDLLFPNVFKQGVTTIDGILENNLLGSMVADILKSLGTSSFSGATNGTTINGRGVQIANVALPVVCMILGLSDAQSFKELENYMPSVISASDDEGFLVYNGSSGVNTGYTDKDGTFTQDSLYTYEIVSATVKAYKNGGVSQSVSVSGIGSGVNLAGGEKKKVKLSNLQDGQLLEFTIEYKVRLEDGSYLGGEGTKLVNTTYSYVAPAGAEKDDDSIEKSIDAGNSRSVKYESEIYIKSGKALSSIGSHGIRIKDNKGGSAATATVTSVTNGNSSYPFAVINSDANALSVSMTGEEGTYFLSPFEIAKKADGKNYERIEPTYQLDENGNTVYDDNGDPIVVGNNGGVPVGKYTITAAVNVGGTNVNVPVNVHIYNDYNLGSIFANAVAANRQQGDYNSDTTTQTLWSDYTTALNNAATLALKPKTGSTFENDIRATDGKSENLYQQYAEALTNAIKALEVHAIDAGVSGIEQALAAINKGHDFVTKTYNANGKTYNYREPMNYYEDGFPFFGMRDYVPHTYNQFRTARDRANKIINSQVFYINTPLEGDYTDEELAAFNDSIKAYDENTANKKAVSSIESAYAIHMLRLTGGRLIRLVANKSKLEKVIDMCITNADINAGGASYYTSESWNNYQNAKTFALKVAAEATGTAENPTELTPSKVNVAMVNLISSWKRLVKGCDYTALDNAVTASQSILNQAATPEENNTYKVFTKDSYDAFYAAYTAAKKIDRNLADTVENNKKIAEIAQNLVDAIANIKEVGQGGGADPVWALITDAGYSTYNAYAEPYSPWIEENRELLDYVGGVVLADQNSYELTGLIFGIPEGGISGFEGVVNADTLENTTVELLPNEAGINSTGSLLVVKNAETEEVIAIYMLVLRGDVDGDGEINAMDQMPLDLFMEFEEDWIGEDNLKYKYFGGDVNYDYEADAMDSMYFDMYVEMDADISQTSQGGMVSVDGEFVS